MHNSTKFGRRDTIFALATAQGRSGVAVIRVSGADTDMVVRKLTGKKLPRPRLAALRHLIDNKYDQIDEALVLWFPNPHSFTGEDVAEFHVHGSPAVIEALSSSLYALGIRQAGPGEFSKRAFQNGKMDLTEAEGLADLIDADTEGQRQQALRQMKGGLRETYENWRSYILDALAYVEGEIDFPDEGDVPDALAQRAGPGLDLLAEMLHEALANSFRGERIRHGVDIAIIGAPNAGKSRLINRLSEKEAAIVSEEAGTTRDVVEVHMELAGLPVRVSDTAGLRVTENKIEAEGVRRALARAEDADIRVLVIDPHDKLAESFLNKLGAGDFVINNKSDLSAVAQVVDKENVSRETFSLSAETGEGFPAFVVALEVAIKNRFSATEQAGLTRARHRDCVESARAAIVRARENLVAAPELSGAELRLALHAVKELAGETDIEAVLDRVFSSFCIGK